MESFIVEAVVGFVQPLGCWSWRLYVFHQATIAGRGFPQGLLGGELIVMGAAGDNCLARATLAAHAHQRPASSEVSFMQVWFCGNYHLSFPF